MKSIKTISVFLVLIVTSCNAQIKNNITENVKIYGNCIMCEKTIETAGNKKNLAQVNWDKETKIASISYDSLITTKEEILKRIALAGYDSDYFLAPDDTYIGLPGCCLYDRVKPVKMQNSTMDNNMEHKSHSTSNDFIVSKELKSETKKSEKITSANPLLPVYNDYLSLKDALIDSDASLASKKAVNLLVSINAIKMNELKMDVHMIWMKVIKDLKADTQSFSEANNIEGQRKLFIEISNIMYSLMKISPLDVPIYYQHCPMANDGKGANWLSKENVIKNPYYGSVMLSCGKTIETIK